MNLNERSIFLLDGVGAALSAMTTGLILPIFSEWIGLNAMTLHFLGLIGFVFSVYSLACFSLVRHPKSFMLIAIIFANTLYSLLALAIAFFSSELSGLGRAYFLGEVAIIAGVVLLEARIYRDSFRVRHQAT